MWLNITLYTSLKVSLKNKRKLFLKSCKCQIMWLELMYVKYGFKKSVWVNYKFSWKITSVNVLISHISRNVVKYMVYMFTIKSSKSYMFSLCQNMSFSESVIRPRGTLILNGRNPKKGSLKSVSSVHSFCPTSKIHN